MWSRHCCMQAADFSDPAFTPSRYREAAVAVCKQPPHGPFDLPKFWRDAKLDGEDVPSLVQMGVLSNLVDFITLPDALVSGPWVLCALQELSRGAAALCVHLPM
jgi:hypothetical protein